MEGETQTHTCFRLFVCGTCHCCVCPTMHMLFTVLHYGITGHTSNHSGIMKASSCVGLVWHVQSCKHVICRVLWQGLGLHQCSFSCLHHSLDNKSASCWPHSTLGLLKMLQCRPAIVSHVSTDTADESSLRQQWLVNAGVHLPATISYIVHVRFVDDCDAPTVPYPSCCVLAPGGLSYTSHKPGTHAQLGVLRKLTGACFSCLATGLLCILRCNVNYILLLPCYDGLAAYLCNCYH